jgi:formylglycine-generating enzyme required for sulfatase activity
MRQWIIAMLVLSALIVSSDGRAQQTGAPARTRAIKHPGAQGEVIVNSIGMKLRLIPAGSFQMGSPYSEKNRENDEGPVHQVTISKPFYLGVYDVTQEQWEKAMGNNPSGVKGANKPVTDVSWNDAQEFVRKLSEKEKIQYRLPTEAEWEYACRAGSTTTYYWGDNFDPRYAWSKENSGGAPHEVGQLRPNAWGLFDMSGNVWQWCEDWHGKKYSGGDQTDPKGDPSGDGRTRRGCSWYEAAMYARTANRATSHPDFRHLKPNLLVSNLGFRLARTR